MDHLEGLETLHVCLREVRDADLPTLWAHLGDRTAQHMAAVTREYHYDRDAFERHWAKVRSDPDVRVRAVLVGEVVAGHVAAYGSRDEREVTYWIGRAHWGHGVATTALSLLLELESVRPLYAHAVDENTGSIRVLEKCGFTVTGRSRSYARARDMEVDELLLTLG